MTRNGQSASYSSYLDWYAQRYGECLERTVETAVPDVTLVATEQDSGHYPDPPLAHFTLQLIETTGARAQTDQGAGRFRGVHTRGDMVISPPDHWNDYVVEDRVRLVCMPIPARVVEAAAADLGRTTGRDLGVLHAGAFQDATVSDLMRKMLLEHQNGYAQSRLYVESALNVIGATLLQHASQRVEVKSHGLPDWAVVRIRDLIGSDLARDFSLDELATEVGYSACHFQRSFKAATGLSPHEFQRDLRLQHAMHLLSTSAEPIIAVALDCGFDNAAYFSTWFKRQTGMTPTKYRAQAVAS